MKERERGRDGTLLEREEKEEKCFCSVRGKRGGWAVAVISVPIETHPALDRWKSEIPSTQPVPALPVVNIGLCSSSGEWQLSTL